MIVNPRLNQVVQCWYKCRTMPLHGRIGAVKIVSRGKPRNHGVEVGGSLYVIPCGNLRSVGDEGQ
jgi:hypothetical protein